MEQGEGAVDGNRSSSPKGGGSRLKAVANVSSEKGSSASDTPRSQRDVDEAIARDQREAEGRDLQEQAEEEEDSDDELARELERELEEAGAEDE